MVERSGDIDNVFKEGLTNYRRRPPQYIWDNVSSQLEAKSRKRIMPMVFAVAASFLLVAGLGIAIRYLVLNDVSSLNNTELGVDLDSKKENNLSKPKHDMSAGALKSTSKGESNILQSRKLQADNNQIKQEKDIDNHSPVDASSTIRLSDIRLSSKESIPGETLSGSDPDNDITNLELTLTEENVINSGAPHVFYEIDTKNRQSNWAVGGEAGPMYTYRDITSGSSNSHIESRMNNAESGLVAYAGGFNVKLKAARRWSFQTGVYYSKMGHSTNEVYTEQNDMYFLSSQEENQDNSYLIVNSTGTVRSRANKPLPPGSSGSTTEDPNTYNQVMVNDELSNYEEINYTAKQYFEYIEIPLYVKFKVIDRKLDFKLIGGLSTNILVDNSTILEQVDNDIDYEPIDNYNYVNYSSTLGLGIEYPFARNFSFNLEPMIKYYLSPINKNPEVNVFPYSIGIFSGISYNF